MSLANDSYAQTATTIDNFDSRTTVAPWTAWKTTGAGTTASVTTIAGYGSTRAMSLNYGFNCTTAGSTCGQFAAAYINLTTPIAPGAAFSFMTRSPYDATLAVRLIDQSGQTLQYNPIRANEGYNPNTWYQAAVSLAKPSSYWGGANNGVIQGQIKSIWIIVETRTGAAASGSVAVDSVAMLSSMPASTISYVNGVATIDDFENRTTFLPWASYKTTGAGTVASVSSVTGYSNTRGLALGYAFNCTTAGSSCGQYAAAMLNLTSTVAPGAAMSLMIRSPLEAKVAVRLIDQSGQTFQYSTARPGEAYDSTIWYQSVIDIGKPQSYWGGANNGVIQGQIKGVWIVVETRTGAATSGNVVVDNVFMLSTMPVNTLAYVSGVATIDDFENRTTVAPWAAWKTSGTGTSASVSAIAGPSSTRALSLSYAFNCTTIGGTCGQYAAATLALSSPVAPGAALRFMTRSAPEAKVSVRLIDESGQTFQYKTARTLDGYSPAAWYQVVVDTSKPSGYWGGANNGVFQGKIKQVWIIVETTTGTATSGTVALDNLAMLSTLPPSPTIELVNGTATIDGFDNRTTSAPWVVQAGNSQSSGYITSDTGFNGTRGIALAYRFDCLNGTCGNYSTAYLALPTPVTAGVGMRVKLRAPSGVAVSLRVQDNSGQTLQYSIPRPLEASNDQNWFGALVALAQPTSYWGGANNGVVQGPIRAVGIVANNSLGVAATGTVGIDEIVTVDSLNSQYTLDPSSSPLIASPTTARSIGTRVGVAHLPSAAATPLDIAKSAGVKFVRMDMLLDSMESNGTYDFSRYDTLVSAVEARGMGVLFILREAYENPRYDVTSASGIATFSTIAENVARHYAGRNVQFEIWNEPDHPSSWSGTPTATGYAALASEAAAGVHRGNASAKVSTGGLSYFRFDFLEAELTAGAARYADAIGLHGYQGSMVPEMMVENYVGAKARIARILGEDKPIWATEWGYSNNDIPGDGHSASFRQRQACLVSRQLLTQWVLDLPKTTWYNLVDYGSDGAQREQNFGLIDLQYTEKPALKAMRMVTTTANGRSYLGLVSDAPAGLHVMRLEDTTKIVFIAWNSQTGTSINLSLPTTNLVSTTDFLGAAVAGSTAVSGYRIHTLTETSGPIFATYSKP